MIEIAVVGAGHWGPNLIRNFDNKTRSRVRWVIDSDQKRLQEVQRRFPGVRLSGDIDDVLADAAVDALVVATPTRTHFSLTRSALEARKHVLVEKPLTDNVASSQEICELAAQVDRVLLVGHVFLYNPAVTWIKERLAEQALGRVHYISSVRTNLGPVRQDVGASWDLAAQDISIMNYWLGTGPTSVNAVGECWINKDIQDVVFATLRYPGERLVHSHVSWINPRKVRDITIVGSERMLTYDDTNSDEPIRLYDKTLVHERVDPGFVDSFAAFRSVVHNGAITIPPVRIEEPLMRECMHFLDCIENGAPARTGGKEGLEVVRALEAMDRSMQNGGREEEV